MAILPVAPAGIPCTALPPSLIRDADGPLLTGASVGQLRQRLMRSLVYGELRSCAANVGVISVMYLREKTLQPTTNAIV